MCSAKAGLSIRQEFHCFMEMHHAWVHGILVGGTVRRVVEERYEFGCGARKADWCQRRRCRRLAGTDHKLWHPWWIMKNYGTRLNPRYYCCWSRDTDVDSKRLLCSSVEGLLLSWQHALKDLAEQLLINVPGWVLTVDLVLKCPESDKHLHPELHALLNGDALLAHDERQVRGPEPLCDPVPVPECNLVNRPSAEHELWWISSMPHLSARCRTKVHSSAVLHSCVE